MDPKLAPSSRPPQAAGTSKTDGSDAAPLRWTTVAKVRLVLFGQAIRPHWFQFLLLAILSGNIGAVYAVTDFCQAYMAGTKSYNIYYVSSYAVSTSFLVSFGAVKAVCDLIVGMLADRIGRRCMHAVGWAFGILLPVMIIAGRNWPTMVAADVFLGVQQGLSWTSAVFMLIDYATRRNAGVGVGVSETMGYSMQALFAVVAGYMINETTKNYQKSPFYLVLGLMVLGLLISLLLLKDTTALAAAETLQYEQADRDKAAVQAEADAAAAAESGKPITKPDVLQLVKPDSPVQTFFRTSFRNPSTIVICIAGCMTNTMTGLAWGLFLKWMAAGETGLWTAFSKHDAAQVLLAYSLIKGLCQFMTGLTSDMIGRKGIIVAGLWTCCGALTVLAVAGSYITSHSAVYSTFLAGAVLLGFGTGLMYPNLLAAISDHTPPRGRPAALGTYRFWRDLGYAVGGLAGGGLRNATGSFAETMGIVAACVFVVGLLVLLVYKERMVPLKMY
ncbi:TPA: hypothetical protein ACH3X3_010828 [Trebouxia sp. C0006]